MKVCLVAKNTVDHDKRTMEESAILARSGAKVVIIGLSDIRHDPIETGDGFCIKRVRTSPGISRAFKDNVYRPIYHKFPLRLRKWVKTSYDILLPLFVWQDKRLKNITTYLRLFKAMLNEKADCYHSHFPFSLLAITFLAAKIRGAKYVSDFNDILIMADTCHGGSYYEQEIAWGHELSETEEERVLGTIRLIPEDVKSIVDIGCGDGRITNRIHRLCPEVVGVDISGVALRHIRVNKIRASVTSLPLKDNSFELALATELLEHIHEPDYKAAVREIERVAANWILIGVPLREQLAMGQARCPRCKTKFHANYHFRSFNDMRKLFAPKYGLSKMEQTGGTRRRYVPWLLWIKHNLGGTWVRTPTTICPKCGCGLYPGNFRERNAISNFCDKRNKRRNRTGTTKSHAVALYQRAKLP
jgi:SAM-dependent methyltransferase